jgi:cytochrome c-type biogenesis protein CcmH/NrfG
MKPAIQHMQQNVTRVAVAYQPYLARTAALLVVMCAVSAFLYGIFLLEAVGQAASRTTAERQIHDISSQLSMLEGQYLAATKELTPERAKALGYVAPAQVSTVIIDGSASSLSFVSH